MIALLVIARDFLLGAGSAAVSGLLVLLLLYLAAWITPERWGTWAPPVVFLALLATTGGLGWTILSAYLRGLKWG